MNDVSIRQETPADYTAVAEVLQLAFVGVKHSDQQEYLLVERLRESAAFVPELSLVAEVNGQIAGHIILTKIEIVDSAIRIPSLALAPVSVHPTFQNQGIGSALIRTAHERAHEMEHTSIILIGHADYYPRFGYRLCQEFGITLPFPAPAENCMVIPLEHGALDDIKGMVEYSAAFFGK